MHHAQTAKNCVKNFSKKHKRPLRKLDGERRILLKGILNVEGVD
jgi:hypothetical protein